MDILLVNAPVKRRSEHFSQTPPLGLSYIAAVLLDNGYDVSAIDFNVSGFNPIRVRRVLEREAPRILGISTLTETYLRGLKIAEIAKQVNPGITVVMGGPHATVMYKEVLREESIDVVVRGEGEYTMLELADCLIRNKGSLAETKGIAYKEVGAVKINPERPFIEDLDELPFPARELFPLNLYNSPGILLTSRGRCPYNCRFCAANRIWRGKLRFRQPEKVLEEILFILEHEQPQRLIFADDTFTLNKEYVVELCGLLRGMKETLPLRWLCSTRVDVVDKELLWNMHEAGCYTIQFGIEAGSQRILDSIGKGITLEQIKYAVRATLDLGIDAVCSFMFPHPEDTMETIGELKQLMGELKDMGAIEYLLSTTPIPGSYYYEHADELGIKMLSETWDGYACGYLVMTTKYLSEEKLRSLLAELVTIVKADEEVSVEEWE